MNKLTIRDKCILLIMILCLSTYAGYHFLWTPVNTQIESKAQQELELKGKVGDGTPLKNQITDLQTQDKELTENIDQHKLLQGSKALNKEDFLTFLTDECAKSHAELVKFNDLGTKEDSGTWKAQFDFELRGSLSSLNSVCQAIDKINIHYSIGGFSLRQNNTHDYLTRFFDNSTRLEWYKDDTPKPEQSPKSDIMNPEMPEMPLTTPAPVIPLPETVPPVVQSPIQTPEPMPLPSPAPKDDSITDRLDGLLKQTGSGNVKYKIVFLTNTENEAPRIDTTPSGDVMLLSITVEFIMYSNPKDLPNSFLEIAESEV